MRERERERARGRGGYMSTQYARPFLARKFLSALQHNICNVIKQLKSTQKTNIRHSIQQFPPKTLNGTELLLLLLGFQTQPTQQPELRITHGFPSALQYNNQQHHTEADM